MKSMSYGLRVMSGSRDRQNTNRVQKSFKKVRKSESKKSRSGSRAIKSIAIEVVDNGPDFVSLLG